MILQVQNQQNSEKTSAANINGAPQILMRPLMQYDFNFEFMLGKFWCTVNTVFPLNMAPPLFQAVKCLTSQKSDLSSCYLQHCYMPFL